ncbi:MAG: DMT family transporter [Bacteroidaceae bacterium]|nr:DMT family transporter [Bacteroidaceae bacterium]
MSYLGELISLGVALLWTVSALAAEVATKRAGVLVLNVWRMALAFLVSALLFWVTTGQALPVMAGLDAWLWLLLSGFVGYFLGDWCLFNSYIVIGSRLGQLFMTLAPAFTAFFAWVMIGQTLSWNSLTAMLVTLAGIGIAVTDSGGTEDGEPVRLKGVLLGIGAALGQGLGLVMSKIGIDHFTSNISPGQLEEFGFVLPFGSNLIRCIAGTVCYLAWYLIRRARRSGSSSPHLMSLVHDRKATVALLITLVSGPFLGVALSLAAVQLTAAGIASTLMAMTPIIILLPSHWLFRQPITLRAILGALISCVGVSLFFLL